MDRDLLQSLLQDDDEFGCLCESIANERRMAASLKEAILESQGHASVYELDGMD